MLASQRTLSQTWTFLGQFTNKQRKKMSLNGKILKFCVASGQGLAVKL